jgi:5-methyltetrahydropteroyltriglutamate--homocysteine methyltransferase
MPRTTPPFRADHVGSLLRPKELLEARAARAAGRIGAAELRAAEDAAIRRVVKLQEDIGLEGVTDGEYRRHSWHMDFLYQIGGIKKAEKDFTVHFKSADGPVDYSFPGVEVVGRLEFEAPIFGDHFAFLKAATRRTAKLTIPAPSLMHRYGVALFGSPLYPDADSFWRDVSAVYAGQMAALHALGCRYLQLDDTTYAALCDPAFRANLAKIGIDAERAHLLYIRTTNEAFARKPADMAICVHTCRGNFRSSWMSSGGYDHLAEALFNELKVDGFFLEYDDSRSGGFEPLRFMPKGKKAVLGLVSSKLAALESKDQIKRRIDEAAKFIPLDQICLSPQCGFASTEHGNALTEAEEIAKLELVVDLAREVWG